VVFSRIQRSDNERSTYQARDNGNVLVATYIQVRRYSYLSREENAIDRFADG
jgi:hypothetical protein